MPSAEKDRVEMEDKDIDAFLAIRVTPNQMNGLKAFRNYVPTPKPLQDAEDFCKSFLIIEMQTQDELQKLLGSMSDFPFLKTYFLGNCKISTGAGSYVQALVKDSRTEEEKQLGYQPVSSTGSKENSWNTEGSTTQVLSKMEGKVQGGICSFVADCVKLAQKRRKCKFPRVRTCCSVEECAKIGLKGGKCKSHGGGTYCSVAECSTLAKKGGKCHYHGG